MYRVAISFVLFCGCNIAGHAQYDEHYVDGWAAAISGNSVGSVVDPVPDSNPTGKCETCNGTGKVGDGRVFTDCLDCGGDGIVGDKPGVSNIDTQSPEVLPVENGKADYAAGAQNANCENGSCATQGTAISYGTSRPIRRLFGRLRR